MITRTCSNSNLTLSDLGKRIQIYTKRRVSQYEWDKEAQLVDCRKNKLNGTELNDWLTQFNVRKSGKTTENKKIFYKFISSW
jgi:hypothetical protein